MFGSTRIKMSGEGLYGISKISWGGLNSRKVQLPEVEYSKNKPDKYIRISSANFM
jgi:hypothetical protein